MTTLGILLLGILAMAMTIRLHRLGAISGDLLHHHPLVITGTIRLHLLLAPVVMWMTIERGVRLRHAMMLVLVIFLNLSFLPLVIPRDILLLLVTTTTVMTGDLRLHLATDMLLTLPRLLELGHLPAHHLQGLGMITIGHRHGEIRV